MIIPSIDLMNGKAVQLRQGMEKVLEREDVLELAKYYGRFNQGVVTINLPDVALSSDGDMDKFWKIFDERLDLCYRALMCRHNRLRGTLSDAAPILWQHGAIARLKKGEPIDRALRRLKKKLDKEGTLKELRNRRHFEKPSEKKRRSQRRRG